MHDTPGATLGDEDGTPSAPQGGATLGDCGGGLTIAALATARGISKDAARRLLRAGKLHAHRTLGPYGPAWCIHPGATGAPGVAETATGAPGVRTGVTREGGATGVPGVAAPPVLAPADAMVSLIQTTIATVLGPLVAELAASRQANERQADAIGQLRADLATAQAENRALMASTATSAPDLTPEPFWTRSPRGWIAGAATMLAIVAAIMLLGWPW